MRPPPPNRATQRLHRVVDRAGRPTGTPDELDVVCHDPVALVPDSRPTPSPIHRHSAWWPDPQVGAIAEHLVTLLSLAQRLRG